MKKRSLITSSILTCTLLVTPILATADKFKLYRVPKGKTAKLIIFQNPTVHSRTVKKLPANTRWIIRLSGIKRYSRRNTWFQVSWNGKKGWMRKNILIFDAKATNMAVKNPKCLRNKTRSKACEGSI
ncbi:MAG: hypothetical protein V3U78_01505 [Thiotrichaceae bacterium]